MKKKIIIGSALILIAASSVYATINSSMISEMLAGERSFTLSSQLNSGESGLTSAPVEGKKTGDILTAKEYNRLLELLAQGGTSTTGGSFSITTSGLVTVGDPAVFGSGHAYHPDSCTNDNAYCQKEIPGTWDYCAITSQGHSTGGTVTGSLSCTTFKNGSTWVVQTTSSAKQWYPSCQAQCFAASGGGSGASGTGVSGYEIVTATQSHATGTQTPASVTATCPGSKRVISGGCSEGTGSFHLINSYPSGGGTSWVCSSQWDAGDSTSASSANLIAYAICID